jgi:hypothetical protein
MRFEGENQYDKRAEERLLELKADFGPEIGRALWHFQGGLEVLKGDDIDARVALMKNTEESLTDKINDALESDDPKERHLGVKALVRMAVIVGNRKVT